MDVHARTAVNRRRLADFFDGLGAEQLDRQSLCAAWTVREVLAHSAMPFLVGIRGLLWRTARYRGSVHRAAIAIAEELATRPVPELTAALREHAEDRVPAPGVGPMGQFADHCIHLRDCARPLGLADDVDLEDWRLVLDWLPSQQAARGVVRKGTLDDLTFRATDLDWSWGSGPEVIGTGEALAMAVSGRTVALDELTGAGVETLRTRL